MTPECIDYVHGAGEERAFYDKEHETAWSGTAPLDSIDFDQLWKDGNGGGDTNLLRSLGELWGKRILLLGNGTSVHEYLFVKMGAHVVYTDLSITAARAARKRFLASKLSVEGPGTCEFHAVNAYSLPWDAESFDIVYGVAFVHHLEDVQRLFSEIYRVLRPGGRCRFADTAYSPLWQGAKRALRPLQWVVHRVHGISPEDVKATAKGGYTERELLMLALCVGFPRLFYRRTSFFSYLLWRSRCKLGLAPLWWFRGIARWVDARLVDGWFMRRYGIGLTFGFDK